MSASPLVTPAAAAPRLRRAPSIARVAGLVGAGILLTLLVIAIAPGLFAPFDPAERVARPFLAPGGAHPLGTNDIGQDLLSELLWGTRVSLATGLIVSAIAVGVGSAVGLLAGYYHGLTGTVLLRLIDLTLVLPFLPLVILLSAYVGSDQRNVILILAIVSWAAPARLIRARVLTQLELPYIEAARALGGSDARIILAHLLPAVRALILVQFVLVAATSILAEASLSFLGLGDPSTKSWGTMLFFAQANGVFMSEAWRWWVLPPGVMITLSVLSLVLLAYALEQRAEPGAARQ